MSNGLAPGSHSERIELLDVLRGVAVLGILLINIIGFGVPYGFSVMTLPGSDSLPNLLAWLLNALFVEGTMRGIFAMLFGAGIVLFTSRLEGAGTIEAADLHVRRMLWLLVFGLINSHVLLWRGDIIFEYAVTGLVVYAFRSASPRLLLLLAAIGFCFIIARGGSEWLYLNDLESTARSATTASEQGIVIDEDDRAAIEKWTRELDGTHPSPSVLQQNTETMRGGFAKIFAYVTQEVTDQRTITYYRRGFFETFSTMLLGIALFRMGALRSAWNTKKYVQLTVVCYGLGLTINAIEAVAILRSNFDPLIVEFANLVSSQLGRVTMAVGHVGLVAILYRSGHFARACRRLAAVGRMALTNYLAQSFICALIFTGVGFGLYGTLERSELYAVVAAIWIAQLSWSSIWLKQFHFGPFEWLWRALTYLKLPAFRRVASN